MPRLVYLFFVFPVVLFAAGPPDTSPPRFSLDRRAPLTTSRVVGFPDPPPPLRSTRVFAKYTFKNPLYLTSHSAHNLVFLVEQAGRIVHLPPDGSRAPELFVQVEDADTYGMTFHPNYRTNKQVYVFSNGPNSKKRKNNQILRYHVKDDPPRCDPASRQVVIEWESNGHNGGDLAFGPDGMLYVTSGDGTTDSDTGNTGQDVSDLCSGVLRIDVDKPAPGKNYRVPDDNPFVKRPNTKPELWAFGFRNPWRMAFDPKTGDLFVGDIGQDLWEMIHLVKKGGNYGWSIKEGSHNFHPNRTPGPGPILPPLIEHPHSESRSITGGFVYQGKAFPELQGVYLYGDYSTGKVWGLKQRDGKVTWTQELAQTRLQILGIGADPAGEPYLVDYAGQIHRLERSPPAKGPSAFPRTLSESGLFASVKDHVLQPAVIPYSVNSQLWSDGATKERALALPGTQTIGFTEQGPWEFPEHTVLVKTFSLPGGDRPRRIETRFLTLQEGQWYGYSYAWNDEQTEAKLVDSGGLTVKFGDLEWRYPSRVECMVCHSRAAAFVLGLSTGQMNREHNYAGVRKNQLEALEQLGVLRIPRQRHADALKDRGTQLQRLAAGVNARPFTRLIPEPSTKALQKRLDTATAPLRAALSGHGGDTTKLYRPLEEFPRMADPRDAKQPLGDRVRSYLHVNCSICHVEAGGGNAAVNLHLSTPLDKMKLVNEVPIHDRFGLTDARLVAPGAPERSILVERLARRGTGQMPPLAASRVDAEAVQLMREWIRQLKNK